jgi:hypothetical protein
MRELRPEVLQLDPGSLPEIFRAMFDQNDPGERGNDEKQKPDKQPESPHSLNVSHPLGRRLKTVELLQRARDF